MLPEPNQGARPKAKGARDGCPGSAESGVLSPLGGASQACHGEGQDALCVGTIYTMRVLRYSAPRCRVRVRLALVDTDKGVGNRESGRLSGAVGDGQACAAPRSIAAL